MPSVSVIMPAYNRAGSVLGSIASVLEQSHDDLELIVIDDCSRDGTAEVVRSVSDPRVKLIELDRNRGAAGARNIGIAAATGIYLAFQDSDDVWTNDFLKAHLAAQRGHPDGCLSFTQVEQRYPDATRRYPDAQTVARGELAAQIWQSSFVSTQTMMVPRALLAQVGGFDDTLRSLEDWDLALRLSRIVPMVFVPGELAIATLSANSLTRDVVLRDVSRKQIMAKHADDFLARPAISARYYRFMAGQMRRDGRQNEARQWAGKALKTAPFDARNWLAAVRAALA